jgi:hypothetical protein
MPPYTLPPTFEQIDATLFALLQTVGSSIVTYSRRLKNYNEVPTEIQPALYLASGDLDPKLGGDARVPGMPFRWKLHRKIWLYTNAGNDDTLIPSSLINPVINSVLKVLAPKTPGDRQTLSGLVYHCYLAGRIQTDEGLLGPQAVAVMPIEILTGEI